MNKNPSKTTPETNSQTESNQASDFNYDSEKLLSVASQEVYKAGLVYFKEDRVIEHYLQQGLLFSWVEGSDADVPYSVELQHDNKGQLHSQCDCSYSLTTASVGVQLICKHAVATLLAFTEAGKQDELYTSAKDTAIRDRIKRGQTEVLVAHVGGDLAFGTWSASSLVSAANVTQQYTVAIRSLSERVNYCTCRDFF